MLKTLNIVQYRKIKGLIVDLEKGINIISGTNGTCKTSLLYIASNAFQAVTRKCVWLKDDKCLDIIKGINATVNPKIEMLTRGDHEYNDPAVGIKGTLFTCTYMNDQTLEFRRHNSEEENRFAVKPFYKRGAGDSLPKIPVIYLGLSRLYPFGEYRDDDSIQSINKKLPVEYLDEISNLYKDFTGTSIEYKEQQKMGDIKNRAEFVTDFAGIDSNTISAGEDNLFIIITALVSLRYYYDCINSLNCVESLLLIDEFDATLHPAFQNKLLSLFDDYSKKYKIQFIFTTHSLSLLEVALKKKHNVIYLFIR
jgi:AAA15 family ATPase/GTPase